MAIGVALWLGLGLITSVLANRLALAAFGLVAALSWTAALALAARRGGRFAAAPFFVSGAAALALGTLLHHWAPLVDAGRAALLPALPNPTLDGRWLFAAALALTLAGTVRYAFPPSSRRLP